MADRSRGNCRSRGLFPHRRSSGLIAVHGAPRDAGLLGRSRGDYFLLEPEPEEELGEVLWFALGWLAVDELPLCEGD